MGTQAVRGGLVLAATPVGNIGDASARLRDLIADADLIAAEDTRRFLRLAGELGVTPTGRIISFHEAVEVARIPQLVKAAAAGSLVLLVTDAGMPSVSDPGYRLVVECIAQDVPVTIAPGPSAVTAALAVSGLPTDRFCFEGFLPRKAGQRARTLSQLAQEPRTMVFFESPHRIGPTLSALAQAFGDDRLAAVCRELTKTYEEVKRGPLAELAQWAAEGLRGEITIVVAGKPVVDEPAEPVDLGDRVAELIGEGTDSKAAIKQAAVEFGVPKREVYDAVLASRQATSDSTP